jgi:sulfate adenylyltransferase subunit 2
MGKDSNVLTWLAAGVCGKILFPAPAHRHDLRIPGTRPASGEKAKVIHGIDLIVRVNEDASPPRHRLRPPRDPVTVTHEPKYRPVQGRDRRIQAGMPSLTGIRRDEDPTLRQGTLRSPRARPEGNWDYKDQPPAFWGQFATSAPKAATSGVQPLLEWTELDIWEYIRRENIPNPTLDFSRNGKRFRLARLPSDHAPGRQPGQQHRRDHRGTEADQHQRARRSRAGPRRLRNSMQELRAKGFHVSRPHPTATSQPISSK